MSRKPRSQTDKEKPAQLAQVCGGRGRKGGTAEVSRRTGFSRREIDRCRQHVALAEKYPVLQGSEWWRGPAIAAGKKLDELPEPVAQVMTEMISESGVKGITALKLLDNMVSKSKREQREIVKLYRSKELHDRNLAKTLAAKMPPSPPDYLMRIEQARGTLEWLEDVPPDYEADIQAALVYLGEIIQGMREDFAALRKKEGF